LPENAGTGIASAGWATVFGLSSTAGLGAGTEPTPVAVSVADGALAAVAAAASGAANAVCNAIQTASTRPRGLSQKRGVRSPGT
jgi:hypothetical protein